MKELRRKLLRQWSRPIAWSIYQLLRVIHLTMRIETVGDAMHDFARRGEVFIGIFWHGRLLMCPFAYPGKRMNVLIGTHRDGQLIADVMNCFGFGLVRGSSSKRGLEAYRGMLRLLETGNDLGVTPDGPRGPAEVLKPGVAHVAKMSGTAVIPIAFSASRCRRFKSWDRFLLPYPFSRGVYVVGDPLRYRKGEGLEEFRQRLEASLTEVTARADRFFGAGQEEVGHGTS